MRRSRAKVIHFGVPSESFGNVLCSSARGGYGRPLPRIKSDNRQKVTCKACLKKLTDAGELCHFGDFGEFVYFEKFPVNCDVMIVCVNDGSGLRPVSLLLPHQLYVKKIEDLLKSYPNTRTITCVPASHADYIDVWADGRLLSQPPQTTEEER